MLYLTEDQVFGLLLQFLLGRRMKYSNFTYYFQLLKKILEFKSYFINVAFKGEIVMASC